MGRWLEETSLWMSSMSRRKRRMEDGVPLVPLVGKLGFGFSSFSLSLKWTLLLRKESNE